MSDITALPHPDHPSPTEAITATPNPVGPPAARPFPLHPNFWWAILWCVFLLLVTQVPGAVVGVAVIVVLALNDPASLEKMNSPTIAVGITVAVVVAHGLMILLSLGVLRIVAGRDWAHQIALRLPSLTHLLLALAMLPAFMVLGNALHEGLKYERTIGNIQLYYPGLDRPASVGAFWAGIVVALLAIGLGHLGCRIVGGRDWYRDWIGSRPREIRWGLSALLLGTFVALGILGFHAFYDLAAEVMPKQNDFTGMEDMVKAFTSMPLLAAIVVIGVFPGWSEELWCRAFLGRGLMGKYGLFWGVLATSFFFGVIHGDPRQGTMAVFMGILLHISYLASRSLLIPVLLHFLNNSLSIAFARFPQIAKVESAGFELLWPLLAAAGVLLIACLFGFWQSRARIVGLWQPEHPGVACPPPQSGSVVVAPGLPLATTLSVLLAVGGFGASCYLVVTRMMGQSMFE